MSDAPDPLSAAERVAVERVATLYAEAIRTVHAAQVQLLGIDGTALTIQVAHDMLTHANAAPLANAPTDKDGDWPENDAPDDDWEPGEYGVVNIRKRKQELKKRHGSPS